MRRCVLQLVFVLIGCMAWVSTADAQSNGALIARFNTHSQNYATAISSGNIDSAQTSWDLMRPLARELVKRGLNQYAQYDREMVRPGETSNHGTGRYDIEDEGVDEDLVEPITFVVVDQLEIEVSADGYRGTVVVVNEEQTGFEDELTEIDVTIRGRVTDQHGNALQTTYLGLGVDYPDSDFEWVGEDEFEITFLAEGFSPVELTADVRLGRCCLSIVKHTVGLGSIRPGSVAKQTFAISNTCDEPLDVAMPSGGSSLSFKIRDCGGGTSNMGSVVDGLGANAMLGPDARCEVEAVWAPSSEKALLDSFSIENSIDLQPVCKTSFEVVGVSSFGVLVIPSEIRFEDVVRVGDSVHAEFVLTNQSSSHSVVLSNPAFTGKHGGDFAQGVIGHQGGTVQNGILELAPGGFFRGSVSFVPVADGRRRAVLDILTSDPMVPHLRIPVSGLAESASVSP